jgi:hypothetical protein
VPRITDYNLGNQRPDDVIKPCSLSSFFKRDVDSPVQTFEELPDTTSAGFDGRFHYEVSFWILNPGDDGCLIRVQSYILVVVHGVLLCVNFLSS